MIEGNNKIFGIFA